jgi:ABC-type proline/glycine betaine transport system substrate-binding protein
MSFYDWKIETYVRFGQDKYKVLTIKVMLVEQYETLVMKEITKKSNECVGYLEEFYWPCYSFNNVVADHNFIVASLEKFGKVFNI